MAPTLPAPQNTHTKSTSYSRAHYRPAQKRFGVHVTHARVCSLLHTCWQTGSSCRQLGRTCSYLQRVLELEAVLDAGARSKKGNLCGAVPVVLFRQDQHVTGMKQRVESTNSPSFTCTQATFAQVTAYNKRRSSSKSMSHMPRLAACYMYIG
jgi:hypothetical protein